MGFLKKVLNGLKNNFRNITLPYEFFGRPRYFLSFLLEKMVNQGKMPIDQQKTIENLSKEGIIVYALKYKSAMDLLYIKTRLYRLGLPDPDFVFDMTLYRFMPFLRAWFSRAKHFLAYLKDEELLNPYDSGYYKEKIKNGKTGVLFLLGGDVSYQKTIMFGHEPIHHLIEIQKEVEKPIFIVPCSVIYVRHPGTESSFRMFRWSGRDKIGAIRKLFRFFRNYKYTVFEIGEPLNLREILHELSPITVERRAQIFNLRRSLVESIDKINRAIVGPALKSKLELKEIILNNPKLQKVMHRRAKSRNIELWRVWKEADKYLDEIAADYSYTMIKLMNKILSWMWDNIFDGVDVDDEGLRKLKKFAQDYTLIYIPSHKSHIDYLLLSYVLFHHNLYPPFIAAGNNLAFWPMGSIFRRGGAFFIRRSFAGQKFYAEVFSLYIKTLIQLGHNIEFFIEGGRSRTGKLVLPKFGLLSIILGAYEEGFCNDLIFVPTAICYDRIPEVESYVRELKGEKKEAENIKQLVKARSVLKKRYGKVYVRFGKPISLAQYVAKEGIDFKRLSSKERHEFYRNFAFKIINSINQASVVTPHSIVSSSLLTTSKLAMTYGEFKNILKLFHAYLSYKGVSFARTFVNFDLALEDTLKDLEKSKIIERIKEAEDSDEDSEVISIEDKKRHTLEYYKNNSIHFFLPASFVSLSLTSQKTFEPCLSVILNDYKWLKELFKYEFAYDDEQSDEKVVGDVIKFFLQKGLFEEVMDPSPCYKLTHEGLKSAEVFASLLYNYLEGYKVCLMGLKFIDKRKEYPVQDFLKKLLDEGNKALKLGIIERPEAISKVMYENCLKFLEERDVIGKKVEKDEKNPSKQPKEYFVSGPNRALASYYLKEIGRFLRKGD